MKLVTDRLMRLVVSKLENLSIRSHNDAIVKTKKLTISYADGTSENDTGFDLPSKCIVLGVVVDVRTAESTGGTKTINVGTLSSDSGDADGLIAGISVASTGVKKPTLASGGQTLGALLRVDEDGAGALVPEPCVSPGSRSITWTPGSNDFAELAADIYLQYIDLT